MGDLELEDPLRRSLVRAWHEYLSALDPIRPDLFRYCRRLTGELWDAEDLVQDSLLRAFSTLSQVLYPIKNPRAYLLRIATNLWIDTVRSRARERSAHLASADDRVGGGHGPDAGRAAELRDAAATLVQHLAPQERAAFLLTEIFGMSLEETAGILGTTVGAAKSALHRGRERLKDARSAAPPRRPRPSRELLDRFVERYAARDLPGLLALMRDDGTIQMHGLETEIGREGFERERGWFHHNFYNPFDGSPSTARWEVAEFEGEPIVLVFGGIGDPGALSSVMRIEEAEGRVACIRVYALCPDVVCEVGDALGLRTQRLGYRFPFDVSGQP